MHINTIYTDNYKNKNIAELIISKHRNGRTGIVKMLFFPEISEFQDMQDSSDAGDVEFR